MDEISSDELRLGTDDDLSDLEENLIATNGQPIYGRHTFGSFNRKVFRADLERFCLIVLRSESVELKIPEVLEVLIQNYRLNFLTSLTYKVKRNSLKTILYLYASYRDEINRFFNEINNDTGHSFLIGSTTIHAKVFNNLTFGNAQINNDLIAHDNAICNLYFNFVPNHTISPSHNLLSICERVMKDDSLKGSINGISLKLNVSHRTLYNYGSFILNDRECVNKTLSVLNELNVPANLATFSSFILNSNQINIVKKDNGGSLKVNEFLLQNNILSNESIIDFSIPRQAAPQNDVANLIPSIVSEVIRNLEQRGQLNFNRRLNSRRGVNSRRGNRGHRYNYGRR